MARKAKKKNRTRKQLGQESLEHRQLLTAIGLTPAAAPVDEVAIPAFVSGAADRDEVHSKAATGSKLDAVKGEGIFSCGSSFPVASEDLSGDSDTWPVAEDATKDPGIVTGERSSVAIPAFAIGVAGDVEPGDAEGLTDKERAYFDAAAHREDWVIVGNPSLQSDADDMNSAAEQEASTFSRSQVLLAANDGYTVPEGAATDVETNGDTSSAELRAGEGNQKPSAEHETRPTADSTDAEGVAEKDRAYYDANAQPNNLVSGEFDFVGNDLASARENLAPARENLASARENLASARENLAPARENLASARENLGSTADDAAGMALDDGNVTSFRDGWIIAGNPSLEAAVADATFGGMSGDRE